MGKPISTQHVTEDVEGEKQNPEAPWLQTPTPVILFSFLEPCRKEITLLLGLTFSILCTRFSSPTICLCFSSSFSESRLRFLALRFNVCSFSRLLACGQKKLLDFCFYYLCKAKYNVLCIQLKVFSFLSENVLKVG